MELETNDSDRDSNFTYRGKAKKRSLKNLHLIFFFLEKCKDYLLMLIGHGVWMKGLLTGAGVMA